MVEVPQSLSQEPQQDPLPQDPPRPPTSVTRLGLADALRPTATPIEPEPEPETTLSLDAMREALRRRRTEEGERLTSVLATAVKADPTLAGEAQRIGLQLDTDAMFTERNIDRARQILAERTARLWFESQSNPILRRKMLDLDFARIAFDDLPQLGLVESFVANFKAGAYGVQLGVLEDRIRVAGAAGHYLERDQLTRALAQLPRRPDGLLSGAARTLGQLLEVASQSVATGLATGAAGAAPILAMSVGPQGAIGLPSAGATFVTGFFTGLAGKSAEVWGRSTSGHVYRQMREQDIPHEVASSIAPWVGVASSALEVVGGAVATGPIIDLVASRLTNRVVEALAKPSMTRYAMRAAGAWAKAVTAEEFTEIAQQLTEIAGVTMAGGDPGPVADQLAEVVVDTFYGTALLAGLPAGAQFIGDMQRARASQRATQLFQALFDATKKSETAKRNPAAYEDFVEESLEGSGAETAYVDASVLDETLKQQGVSRAEFNRTFPDIAQQLASAVSLDDVVEFSSAKFFAQLANTPLGQSLLPHLRASKDGLSMQELLQTQQETQERLKVLQQQFEAKELVDREFADSARRVSKSYEEQLTASGVKPKYAKTLSMFYRNWVAQRAEAQGMSPEQFHEQFGVRVAAEMHGRATVKQFAGEASAVADKLKLANAQRMLEQGASREDILKETGWFLGPDSRWRYEISDQNARFATEERDLERLYRLSDVLDHPGLFEAYPSLKNVPIRFEPLEPRVLGYIDPRTGAITLNVMRSRRDQLSTLLHEIQHAIQLTEEFAEGGSPNTVPADVVQQIASADAMRLLNELQSSMDPEDVDLAKRYLEALDVFSREVPENFQEAVESLEEMARELQMRSAKSEALFRVGRVVAQVNKFNVYERLAGEVEARNVERRRSMSESDRLWEPPWVTADVKESKIVLRFGDTYKQLQSTRRPWSAKSTIDAVKDLLLVDYDLFLADADLLAKSMDFVRTMPQWRRLTGPGARNPRAQAEAFVEFMKDNLLWLYNLADADFRARSRQWYEGANKLAQQLADTYGVTLEQSAAILAVLSPNVNWFQNVSMAERMLQILTYHRADPWTDAMTATADRILAADPLRGMVQGKTLDELMDTPAFAARWIRVWDETYNPRSYRVPLPEGGFGDFDKTKSGEPRSLGWTSYQYIAKAVSVYRDGSGENIFDMLGYGHKVRNFYGNIYAPSDPRFVTIDTHAIAAGLLQAVGGKNSEVVSRTLGGPPASAQTGLQGLYALFYEATRRAAAVAGVLPREIQSITWEAVRALMSPEQKRNVKFIGGIEDLWRRYKRGELNQSQVQALIAEAAGGLTMPSWIAQTKSVADTSYDIPAPDVRASYAPEVQLGSRAMIEVAPDPTDTEAVARWRGLSPEAQAQVSLQVAQQVFRAAAEELGVSGTVELTYGGWLDDVNPSLAMALDQPELLSAFGALAGHMLRQQGVYVISGTPVPGASAGRAVTITLPDGSSREHIEALHAQLRQLEHNGVKLVTGNLTAGPYLVIGISQADENNIGLTANEIGQRISDHIGETYVVNVNNAYTNYIDREAYADTLRSTLAGRSPTEERLGQLRASADQFLNDALAERATFAQRGRPDAGRGAVSGEGPTPSYGTPRPGSTSVLGIHYSREARQTLDTGAYGTGLRGAEAARVAGDPLLSKRTYFYVDTGAGVEAELGVGGIAHEVQLENLYDLQADPLGIMANWRTKPDVPLAEALNAAEREIVEAGYDGYFVRRAQFVGAGGEATQGAAVVIGPQHTAIPVRPRERLQQMTFGEFDPASLTIILNQDSNLSTVLHEMGHYFLTVLGKMASLPDASPQDKADFAALLDWFGVDSLETWNAMSLKQQEAHHEQFAHAFERYLFEGKAPTAALKRIFASFRTWLIHAYRSLIAGPNERYRDLYGRDLPVLNKEVRAVFDRLVAGQQAIEREEALRGMLPAFQTREEFVSAGYDGARWDEYQVALAEAREAAVIDVTSASLRQLRWLEGARSKVLKELQAKEAKVRERVEKQVRAELQDQPVHRAEQTLRYGTAVDDDGNGVTLKLDLDTVRALVASMLSENDAKLAGYVGKTDAFIDAVVARLGVGQSGMLRKDGMPPDLIAQSYGFANGEALVRALMSTPRLEDHVRQATDQRMIDEHSDLTDPEQVKEAVDQALVHEARLRFVATELKFLSKSMMPVRVLRASAREAARQALEGRAVKDVQNYRGFIRAAERAARDAAKATGQAAVEAKQRELLQREMANLALEARDFVNRSLGEFRNVTRAQSDKDLAKTRSLALVQAARWILSRYGLASATAESRATDYLALVQQYDPALFESLQPLMQAAAVDGKDYTKLTLEQFRALQHAIESLWYRAKRDKVIETAEGTKQVEEVVEELLPAYAVPQVLPGEERAPTQAQVLARDFLTTKALLARVEHVMRKLDGGKHGAHMRYISDQLHRGLDNYRVEHSATLQKLVEIVSGIDLPHGTLEAPELNYTFGAGNGGYGLAELLGALLHTGNLSNKEKMIGAGRGPMHRWGQVLEDGSVDFSAWDKFQARLVRNGVLTKKHFDTVQRVWDLLESLKKPLQEAHREVFGRYFREVKALPFRIVFPDGQTVDYRGGYVPARADQFLRPQATAPSLQEMSAEYRKSLPAAPHGFTKERIETYRERPLSLDIRQIAGHVDEVLRFSYVQPRIKDILRILQDDRYAGTLARAYPRMLEDMLIPWLERSARQNLYTPGMMPLADRFWRLVRRNTGIAVMFASPVNALQQYTGISAALAYVPARHLKQALVSYMRGALPGGESLVDKAHARSPFLRDRAQNQVGSLRDELDSLLLNPSKWAKAQAWSTRKAYFLQAIVQNQVDTVVWWGAYQHALQTGGPELSAEAAEARAIAEADSAVRLSQGSQLPEDVAGYDQGSPFWRSWTQFTGYFSNVLNTVLGQNTAGRKVTAALVAFTLPMIASEAIAKTLWGTWDDEDDDGHVDTAYEVLLGAQFRGAAAFLPVWGPAVLGVIEQATSDRQFGDRVVASPAMVNAVRALAGALGAARAALDDEMDLTGRRARDAMTLITLLTGVPVAALGRPVSYWLDVEAGRVEPTSMLDAIRGSVTGRASEASR